MKYELVKTDTVIGVLTQIDNMVADMVRKSEQSTEQEPVAFEMDWPEFHQEAMGCGLEDRNITDRYEAMQYGWEEALDRCAERLPEILYTQPQEPVAWKDAMKVAFWRMYEHGKNDNPVSAQCEVQALGMLCNGEFDDITAWHPSQWKLPPQRQPLTDEQIGDIAALFYAKWRGHEGFARAIEAAHGITGDKE